jgi:hypothetical protein
MDKSFANIGKRCFPKPVPVMQLQICPVAVQEKEKPNIPGINF